MITFSPTGNTRRAEQALCTGLKLKIDREVETFDITYPEGREKDINLNEDDILIIGFPVYASRLPNKIVGYLKDAIKGKRTPAIGMVTYGNRSYGDGLSELFCHLKNNGILPIAGISVPGEHSFSEKLATGRPNQEDLEALREFGKRCGQKILKEKYTEPYIKGNFPPGPYYKPKKEDGSPANILKVKPVTDRKKCTKCGICSEVCPMGSIDKNNFRNVVGICIKCMACIKYCPEGAKQFIDRDFLSHVKMVEKNFTYRKEIETFL